MEKAFSYRFRGIGTKKVLPNGLSPARPYTVGVDCYRSLVNSDSWGWFKTGVQVVNSCPVVIGNNMPAQNRYMLVLDRKTRSTGKYQSLVQISDYYAFLDFFYTHLVNPSNS